MMESVEIIANEMLVNISLGVVSLFAASALYVISRLNAWIKKRINQIEDETAREKLENALSDVERLAAVTVAAVEQTTAKVLREAVKNGKVDKCELEALAVLTKKKIANAIKPEAQQVISDNLGSFDDYVAKLIEERVLEIKTATGA